MSDIECPFCFRTRGVPPFTCARCHTAIPIGSERASLARGIEPPATLDLAQPWDDQAIDLRAAIDRLGPQDQELLHGLLEGKSERELAKERGWPKTTLRRRLRDARRRLREVFTG